MTHSQLRQLTGQQRWLQLLKLLLKLLLLLVVLTYGFSIITNVLTQLNHIKTSIYIMVCCVSYGLLVITFVLLIKSMNKHLRSIITGLKPL